MIEGIKVTVLGDELRMLCLNRAEHHKQRVQAYTEQVANMESAAVEGMNYTNGNPVQALKDRIKSHAGDADEMEFIASHVKLQEEYLLDSSDLVKLGVARSKY